MEINTILLGVLVGLVALGIYQANQRHADMVDLINDLATMLGELFE